ncbi:non-ribosomal peptide synthetase [Kitasatospora sp. LaBMicrA B282]|uniref:non-ribosomal peptide synthetase n=1 Tax=Kitasatospora sp. LaBMicrA B282 TaxID=3420949 RepID=UPI003D130A8E
MEKPLRNAESRPTSTGTSTLTELFRNTVDRHPERTAVSDGVRSLSYAELDRLSDRLAAALRARGVRPETRVGIHLDRSVDLVLAVLGVVKAGGATLVIDTRYPAERRALMLRAGGAALAITAREYADALAGSVPQLLLAEEFAALPADPAPVEHVVAPFDAASVLFTSGSTGRPKAIVLEHRNLVSFATNPAVPAVRAEDRVGQISNVSFDAFHFELWCTLAAGAELVVLPEVPALLSAGFRGQLGRHGVSVMIVPTMVVNHVVREERDAFAGLRVLVAGGDVLQPAACRELLAGDFAGELHNMYGPAEITTACTAHLVTVADAAADSVPIGRALHGVTLHVLDAELRPVPDGAPGELFVAGPGVARGYLGAPELTAERFLSNPLGPGSGRLYRTGDLVRRRPDGVLEFVGRSDDQVKVRGYRVEPGEVEQGLQKHPLVHEAVVLPDGEGGDRRLMAFVVLDDALTLRELRAHAQAVLPPFMVPSELVLVPRIPVTAHGKRDLAELRVLLADHRARTAQYTAPATDIEVYLAELWEELLGVERIGLEGDFFALGGHSLQTYRVKTRIKSELGVDLPHPVLVSTPVLGELAAVVDRLIEEALA